METLATESAVRQAVRRIVSQAPIIDIHTHIYPPAFGGLLLWGADELITYHYLVAETFRLLDMKYEDFWAMSKTAQSDLIWKKLFVERSPISESCRGVLTCLRSMGLDVASRDLAAFRRYYASRSVEQHVDDVFRVSNAKYVVMTNNPFDPSERAVWDKGVKLDPRFKTALRVDELLVNLPAALKTLNSLGYKATDALAKADCAEIRRFLTDWIDRMNPLYMAASLPPSFMYPEESAAGRVLDACFLPLGRERRLPLAMMIGVKKLINPGLRLAGDGVGKSRIEAVENLCAQHPDNKFLVTFLARENQHECCIAARKFRNLHVFGCWWFLNNPSIIDEITRERIETLGLSVTPQHSDSRVLDQLIYKWAHSRIVIGKVLEDKYADLVATGWQPTTQEIERDVNLLFGGAFEAFLRA